MICFPTEEMFTHYNNLPYSLLFKNTVFTYYASSGWADNTENLDFLINDLWNIL
jgi:hypothetical protein